MPESAQRRPGLDPLPGRVPPLPGGTYRSQAAVDPAAAAEGGQTRSERRPTRRAFRAIETQVDQEIRRFIETTAFTIRLRTESSFDRSTLMRGILRAVLRSGLDLSDCDTEEEITAALARHLPPGGS